MDRRAQTILVIFLLLCLTAGFLAALPRIDLGTRGNGAEVSVRWPIPADDPHYRLSLYTLLGGENPADPLPGQNPDLHTAVGAVYTFPLGSHSLEAAALLHYRYDFLPAHQPGIQGGLVLDRTVPLILPGPALAYDYRINTTVFVLPGLFSPEKGRYTRFNTTFRNAFQLVNRVSWQVYLVGTGGFDRLFGDHVPEYILASVGEMPAPFFTTYPGLGGTLRGIEPGSYPGRIKVYYNFELEFLFKTDRGLNPGFLLFWDMGNTSTDEFLTEVFMPRHHTVGTAFYLDLLGVSHIGYFAAYCPTEPERKFGHGLYYGIRIRS